MKHKETYWAFQDLTLDSLFFRYRPPGERVLRSLNLTRHDEAGNGSLTPVLKNLPQHSTSVQGGQLSQPARVEDINWAGGRELNRQHLREACLQVLLRQALTLGGGDQAGGLGMWGAWEAFCET